MARHRISSIRKPQGWRGQSYRHYLAAKGIKSPSPNSYFVRDEFKGNRDAGGLKAAYAKGFTKEDLRRDDAARAAFGISEEELTKKRKSVLPERFPGAGPSDVDFSGEVEELPEESEPGFVNPEVDEFDGMQEGIQAQVESRPTPPAFDPVDISTDPTADVRTPENAFFKKSRRLQ